MKVQEIMSTNVEFIKPDTALRHAARRMKDLGVGALPIVEDGKLLGIITDRDIACFAVAMGRDPSSTPVSKCMTADVTTCLADLDVNDAAGLMTQHQIRRLAVVNQANELTGVLSVDDLVRASHDLAGSVLEAATMSH